ncbi:hypothetical protein [Pseudoruminococcus massiliensis]
MPRIFAFENFRYCFESQLTLICKYCRISCFYKTAVLKYTCAGVV